jgi:DNA-binding transcriptional regulator YhcF (GntR family)
MSQDSDHSYRRIAASLRARIESGDLRPGQRVPSTRALAKKWKVALATASHALNMLAAEGWVRALPRVGVVVASHGPSDRLVPSTTQRATPTMREKLVAAAIAMADEEGLAAVSLRGVAARLDTPATSLYRHVQSKDELLQLMTDAALAEERFPEQRPAGWRAQLELAARLQWKVLRRHPWLARVMGITRPRPLASSLAYADWVLGALDTLKLNAAMRMQLHIVLYAFVQGMAVNLESEAEAVGETGLSDDEWMQTQLHQFSALAATGHYPAFSRALTELTEGFDLDFDALFELGLHTLLDGFAAATATRRSRASYRQ